MEKQTKIGVALLVPPVLSWSLVIMVVNKDPVGLYIVGRMNPAILDIGFFVGGLIFPSAALVIALNGLLNKQDKQFNIAIIVLSASFFIATLLVAFNPGG